MDRCLDPKSNSPYPASHVKMKNLLLSDDSIFGMLECPKRSGKKCSPKKKNKRHPQKKNTRRTSPQPSPSHFFQGVYLKNIPAPSPFEVMVDQKGKRLPARPPLLLDLSEAVGMVG